ncbi:MAG TPA: hypothetical protein VHW96_05830 [Solirubrobacteraceae bacterium]|jgi:hypothetical protein|nr:hypothetical protein [Solirubrobacteraceae bacterium]
MFDGHKHLEKKLRKNGARGMANIVVADETQVDRGSMDAAGLFTGGAYRWHYRFEVRVTPEQGTPFTASFSGESLHPLQAGDQLPVLFNPRDQDKICIDHERIQHSTAGTGVRVQVVSREDGSVRTVHAGEEVRASGRTIEMGPDGSIRITNAPRDDASDPPADRNG